MSIYICCAGQFGRHRRHCPYWNEEREPQVIMDLTERSVRRACSDTQPAAFLITPIASTPSDELRRAAEAILYELNEDPSEIDADNKSLQYLAESLRSLAGLADLHLLAGNEPPPAIMEVLTVNLLLARSLIASAEADVQ